MSDPNDPLTDCSSASLQAAQVLSFKQRACFFRRQVFTPQYALSAAFASAYGQYRDSPKMFHRGDFSDFERRYEIHYAHRTARTAAELLVGYLHHEDPRLRRSTEHGFWKRVDFALLNVATSPDDDGRLRLAFAPMAGAFSSALVSGALYRHDELLPNTVEHGVAVYAFYFVRSVCREFKPDITSYTRHLLHRDN